MTVFINILNTVKEQNNRILTKLENLEKANNTVQSVGAAGNSGNPLPVELPLRTEENISVIEKSLEDKSNFARLVNIICC